MKFILEIEIGNDAMQTYVNIAEALANVAQKLKYDFMAPVRSDWYTIRDINGNTVGKWFIEK